MKIACISDTHGQHHFDAMTLQMSEVKADLLLCAGDVSGTQGDGMDFVEWMGSLPFPYKVCTFGNHDFMYKSMQEYAKAYPDITFLNNEHVVIEGIKIYGSPYSLPYFDWCFMADEPMLKRIYGGINSDTNIILSHGAAYGILDQTWQGIHTGSRALLERIPDLKDLRLCVWGHIHEAYGQEVRDGVTYVNASLLNKNYRIKNKVIIYEYESR